MSSLVATIMTMVPMVANLTVPFLAKRMGKRNLYSAAAGVQLAGLVVILAADLNTVGIMCGAFVTALGYGIKESIYFPCRLIQWITVNGRRVFRRQVRYLL